MVVKRRLLLAVASGLTLVVAAATPMLGASSASKPDPLRSENLIRVQDIAATVKTAKHGPVVAVGWREASSPGELYLTFSVDGGKSFRKARGGIRQSRIAGNGGLGMSLDVCDGRIWVGTALNAPGDSSDDTDVLLTSRTVVGGVAAQAFLTDSSDAHRIRDVSVACVGKDLLAIAWLEKGVRKTRGKLMLRSLEQPGATASFRQVFGLGEARFKDGISVAASTDTVHVAWATGGKRDVAYKRYVVVPGAVRTITKHPTTTFAYGDALFPEVATRGKQVVVAYTDGGKIKTRLSGDAGATFAKPSIIMANGKVSQPSLAHSVALSGPRIVVEATVNKRGAKTPQRIETTNSGGSWRATPMGHQGARVGALQKLNAKTSRLKEAWQNNTSGADTLRAQYETR